MNKVIDQLVDITAAAIPGVCQLEYESGKSGVEFTDEALEKFVELIINKTSEVMEDQDYFYGEWMGRIVKKYFGVVEY